MSEKKYRIRRATVDDISILRPMWESLRLPAPELEKRVTEFQVAAGADDIAVGAVGFQMAQQQGCLHSEAYSDFSIADDLRPLFWERIQILASNHGILRVWTQEDVPFWTRHGFQIADANAMKRFPAAWANENPSWRTYPLKDEEAIQSMEKELSRLMEHEKRETAEVFQRAQTMKNFVTWLLVLVFAVCTAVLFFIVLRKNPDMFHIRK